VSYNKYLMNLLRGETILYGYFTRFCKLSCHISNQVSHGSNRIVEREVIYFPYIHVVSLRPVLSERIDWIDKEKERDSATTVVHIYTKPIFCQIEDLIPN
jgi:hypothetical protein